MMFEHVDAYAGDPILSLVETFKKDPRETKVNLGIGIYYDDQGRLPLLPSVVKAETALAQHLEPRPYLPMEGLAAYRTACQNLLFGASTSAGRPVCAITLAIVYVLPEPVTPNSV